MEQIIASVELGDTHLRAAVARQRPGSTRLLAYMESPSAGIRDHVVTDSGDLANALSVISHSLRKAVDFPLENVIIVVPPGQLEFHQVEVGVRPSGPRGRVTKMDEETLRNKSGQAFSSEGRRLLHIVPQTYFLDGVESERLPLGRPGKDLRAFSLLVSCDEATAANIYRAAHSAGSESITLVAAPIAESLAALTDVERERGAAILTIGERMSTVSVTQYGHYLGSANFRVGANHFRDDVARALRLPYSTVDLVLNQVGVLTNTAEFSRGDIMIDNREISINWVETVTVLRDRAEELFSLTAEAILNIAGDLALMNGLTVSGRTILRHGLPQVGRTIVGMPVHWAAPHGIEGIPLAIYDSTEWVSSIGSLVWAGTVGDHARDQSGEPLLPAEGARKGGGSPLRRLATRLGSRSRDHVPAGRTSSVATLTGGARRAEQEELIGRS